jgi:hypothetical protein
MRFAVCSLVLAWSLSAHAHHSGVMFDSGRSVTLTGTVKAFQWTNPHCWIQLVVPEGSGAGEWSIEMGAPIELYRGGWRRTSLKPGDPIVIVIHPLRSGARGGLFVSAAHADGTDVGAPR